MAAATREQQQQQRTRPIVAPKLTHLDKEEDDDDQADARVKLDSRRRATSCCRRLNITQRQFVGAKLAQAFMLLLLLLLQLLILHNKLLCAREI